jgi:SOS-response transcriptional repressor LexA
VARVVTAGYREVPGEEVPPDWRGRFVPILGRLAAGEGIDVVEAEQFPPGAADSFVEYRGAPARAFAVRVVGDSMLPGHQSGDLVVVAPDCPVQMGLACVLYETDEGDRVARLKRLRREGRWVYLESTNPAFPPVRLEARRLVGAFAVAAHLPRLLVGSA